MWSLLADDLGAEDQSNYHAQQSHRERLGKMHWSKPFLSLKNMSESMNPASLKFKHCAGCRSSH